MNPVLWIIPTRGRPANAARLHAALGELGACSDWAFIVDEDDPTLDLYLDGPIERAHFLTGPAGRRMGPIVNHAWEALARGRGYAAVGFLGDDHLPRTYQFDLDLARRITEADGRGWGVAWGDDLLIGAAFPTAGILGGAMLDAMGYMVPPGFDHLCIDVAWSDLGERLGRRYYDPAVIVEHLHPAAGKAKLDASYRANNAMDTYEHDAAALVAWRTGDRQTDLGPSVERIQALGGSVGEQEATP